MSGTLLTRTLVVHVPFVGCWERRTWRNPSSISCARARATAVRPSGIRLPMVRTVSRLPGGRDSAQSSSVFAVARRRGWRTISWDART
ncbi:hypothetical protein ACFQ0M_15455 [Kitasatospora aburaviensis]